ncbi:hypothetical protein ACRTDJ_13275 [Shewanella algae]
MNIAILYASFLLSVADIETNSLNFNGCGDQILSNDNGIVIRRDNGEIITRDTALQELINEYNHNGKTQCLKIKHSLSEKSGFLTLDFNRATKRYNGFDSVYEYDNFGNLILFYENKKGGRHERYIYKNGELSELEDLTGTTIYDKKSNSVEIDEYDYNGRHVRSDNYKEPVINKACQETCYELLKELKKGNEGRLDNNINKLRSCFMKCVD